MRIAIRRIRRSIKVSIALGAAYAAGLAVGFWTEVEELRANWQIDKQWEPRMDSAKRADLYDHWLKAVTRTFDWA